MKPEYYQISWQEFVDTFGWSSFLTYLTSGYGLPVLCAALVFPVVLLLKNHSKIAVRTAAFIQFFTIFIMTTLPELYGGLAIGYDQMLIDLYVIRLIGMLVLIGGAYWTMYSTHRYQIGGRIVVGFSLIGWGFRALDAMHRFH